MNLPDAAQLRTRLHGKDRAIFERILSEYAELLHASEMREQTAVLEMQKVLVECKKLEERCASLVVEMERRRTPR